MPDERFACFLVEISAQKKPDFVRLMNALSSME